MNENMEETKENHSMMKRPIFNMKRETQRGETQDKRSWPLRFDIVRQKNPSGSSYLAFN